MLVSIGLAADIFVGDFAERRDPLVDCRSADFAIGAGRYRDKPDTTLCALYRGGYE